MERTTPLQKLEMEAYTAVLRALAATAMDWSKEKLMTEIRRELHISTEEHYSVLSKVMGDEEITAIREGRPLPVGSAYAPGAGELPSRRSQAQLPSPRGPGRSTSGRAAPSAAIAAAAVAERRGPGRPPNSRGRASDMGLPAVRKRGKHRTAGAASGTHELVGRTILRHFPEEHVPWAKGLITDYQPASNRHTIVYDINTPEESWEEVNLSLLMAETDYQLQEGEPRDMRDFTSTTVAPLPLRSSSISRSNKRKASGGLVPYSAGLLQEQLASSSTGDMEAMRESLEERARELIADLMALAAPASEHPDPVDRLQLQLQDLASRERTLTAQLEALPLPAGF